jgi:hypothetical protein
VYALDTTTIDLCLSVFPCAVFRAANKAAIKLHTLLDLRDNIPPSFTSVMARCTRSRVSMFGHVTPAPAFLLGVHL